VAIEPDGHISLDWLPSRTQMLSLSIGDTNRVAYNWVDGIRRGYGVEIIDSGCLPLRILDELRRI